MLLDFPAIFTLNIDLATCTFTQLKTVLKFLRTKNSTGMPTQKADLYVMWLEWKSLPAQLVEDVMGEDTRVEVGVLIEGEE